MKIEGTININTIITAATLLLAAAGAYATLDKRITLLEELTKDRAFRVEEELKDMRKELKEISKAIADQGNHRRDRQ